MDIEGILQDISIHYGLNYDELKMRYLSSNEVTPKKRGRKKKQKEEYVEAEEYVYNGALYLVDAKNVVYTNDLEAPCVVGERLIDGSIKFCRRRTIKEPINVAR
jgi:hypothetical protein